MNEAFLTSPGLTSPLVPLSIPERCSRYGRGGRSAFTLIELLVVIAIIAVLAAILFPVFAQARERARQSACISNLKQVGIAVLQYNQDYDENYPISYYQASDGTFSASKTTVIWARIVQPYIKNTQVFRCPSDARESGNVQGTGDTPETRYPVSYAYNYFLGGNFSSTGIPGSDLPQTVKAAQTVMLVDGASTPEIGIDPARWKEKRAASAATTTTPDTQFRSAWLLVHAGTSLATSSADYGAPLARHQGRVNLLWGDGHAKSAKVESFYTLKGTVPQGGPTGSASCPGIPNVSADCSPCLEPTIGCKE